MAGTQFAMLICIIMLAFSGTTGFQLQRSHHHTTSLNMAKKKNRSSEAKGFGKVAEPKKVQPIEDVASAIDRSATTVSENVLTSVEGGSKELPKIDESVPVEDRAKSILRDQYGLRTREEQQEAQRREEAAKEQRKKLEKWKEMADEGQDFDIMRVLPAPVLVGIDRFLKIGVTVSIILFVFAGIFITIEAYSKTTGNALPEDLDRFIVNTVEPNFTPGLGVLLGFSISLGAFAAAQLSSASSNYREDR